MRVTPLDRAGPEPSLDALLAVEPHLDYANFQPVAERAGAVQALHRERWVAGEGQAWLARDASGRAVGALRAAPRPFESAHFGMAMARLEAPIAVAEAEPRFAALRALYATARADLSAAGCAHVAARLSTRDREGCWAVQEAGGRWVDTQVSWMCPLSGTPHDEAVPGALVLEVHDRASVAALPRATWKRLAEWGGTAFDRGPLVFDRTLPAARARAVYESWTERVMTGEWADAVLLARDGDEIVAFISMQELPDVSRAARTGVCGRGLGATLQRYRGLFSAIQREMIARRPLGASFMENETQVSTIGSMNVYAKLGFRYLRSTATFHLHLDDARARCG